MRCIPLRRVLLEGKFFPQISFTLVFEEKGSHFTFAASDLVAELLLWVKLKCIQGSDGLCWTDYKENV